MRSASLLPPVAISHDRSARLYQLAQLPFHGSSNGNKCYFLRPPSSSKSQVRTCLSLSDPKRRNSDIEIGPLRPKTAVLLLLLGPIKTNRENISKNREFLVCSREFLLQVSSDDSQHSYQPAIHEISIALFTDNCPFATNSQPASR